MHKARTSRHKWTRHKDKSNETSTPVKNTTTTTVTVSEMKKLKPVYKPLKDLFAIQQQRWDAMFAGEIEIKIKKTSESDSSTTVNSTSNLFYSDMRQENTNDSLKIKKRKSHFEDYDDDNNECSLASSTNISVPDNIKNNEQYDNMHDTSLEDFLNEDDTIFSEINEADVISNNDNNNNSFQNNVPISPNKIKSTSSSTSSTSSSPMKTSPTTTPTKSRHNKTATSPSKYNANSLPYYVEHFKMIILTTINDKFFSDLFENEDRNVIDLFLYKLSVPQQKLFTRLYLRKFRWLRLDQISYSDVGDNIKDTLDSLVQLGFIDDVTKITDLNEVLKCLQAPDLKTLSKSLRLDSGLSKNDLINAIVNHSKKNSIGNFFMRRNDKINDDGVSFSSLDNVVLTRAKKILGPCYKLNKRKRSIFMRILILSSLSNTVSDDDLSAQQIIFQMLQTSTGQMRYPEYIVSKTTRVFQSRKDLLMYEDILEFESSFWRKMENKKYDEAFLIYDDIRLKFEDFSLNEEHVTKYNQLLPTHLRYYTTSSAYIRILNKAVSLLQFLKRYEDATQLLDKLLNQYVYHLDYRGRWFDRITLNLDFHLKKPAEALNYIIKALNDPWVKVGHRLDLLHRGRKILTSSRTKKQGKMLLEGVEDVVMGDAMNFIQHAPSITITGHQLPKNTPVAPSMWLVRGSGSDDVMMVAGRVEQVALDYYATVGYPEGIHGEGITLTTLFMLMSWDIVFMSSITDVFYDNFQTVPLDFRAHDFYCKREEKFDERFKWIADATDEDIDGMLEKCWSDNHGVICPWINWDVFAGADGVKGLVKSIGAKKLSCIFMRMAQNMRYVTGGVPDLLVWNPSQRQAKFVEVKGPGDKLSSKQILWLDFLLSIGVDAEVCHVKAEHSKKIIT